MANARVGDDVYGEDPTVNELELKAAKLVGMEAGLLVSSGTMGNLVAALTHSRRGDEAIVGEDSHCYRAEAGGLSALGGIFPRVLPTDGDGQMSILDVDKAIRPDDPHYGRTRLVLLENSYAARGGNAIPVDYFGRMGSMARERGLALHLDGARLFNAAAAQSVPASDMTQHVDSVSFCLSKGLCAPVGSVLCGSAEFNYEARRARKVVGGGMRQAGVIAAAGIVALEEMIHRLPADQRSAHVLADGLRSMPEIEVEPVSKPTNMVFFSLRPEATLTAAELSRKLIESAGIYIGRRSERSFRAVTHYWVGKLEIERLLEALKAIFAESYALA